MLDKLNLVGISFLVGIPRTACIFEFWADKGFICLDFDMVGASTQYSSQQAVEKYLAEWTLDMAWPFIE